MKEGGFYIEFMWSNLPFFLVVQVNNQKWLLDENYKEYCRLIEAPTLNIGDVISLNEVEFYHNYDKIDYFSIKTKKLTKNKFYAKWKN